MHFYARKLPSIFARPPCWRQSGADRVVLEEGFAAVLLRHTLSDALSHVIVGSRYAPACFGREAKDQQGGQGRTSRHPSRQCRCFLVVQAVERKPLDAAAVGRAPAKRVRNGECLGLG